MDTNLFHNSLDRLTEVARLAGAVIRLVMGLVCLLIRIEAIFLLRGLSSMQCSTRSLPRRLGNYLNTCNKENWAVLLQMWVIASTLSWREIIVCSLYICSD